MPVDYHMHTPLCKHATGMPREYVEQALARGLPEIGFSDHNPMPDGFDPTVRMSRDDFPEYLRMIRAVQRRYSNLITIRFGIEADFHPGTEEYVREFLASAPFDYVIGSVHYLEDWPFDNPEYVEEYLKRDIDEIYRNYYALIERMAHSKLYDIAGHLDVVKKFGHRPKSDMTDAVRRALGAIRDAGMCYEVNTSGLRKPCKEIYPEAKIVTLAARLGVPVTLGSDSHEPKTVGQDYDRAIAMLREAGYREVWRFEGRRRFPVPLP